jgi:hypothetical protein
MPATPPDAPLPPAAPLLPEAPDAPPELPPRPALPGPEELESLPQAESSEVLNTMKQKKSRIAVRSLLVGAGFIQRAAPWTLLNRLSNETRTSRQISRLATSPSDDGY